MDPAVTRDYIDRAAKCSRALLSINHETNAHTVAEHLQRRGDSFTRVPCYIRKGHVEEVVQF
jgi:hypothetical protein